MIYVFINLSKFFHSMKHSNMINNMTNQAGRLYNNSSSMISYIALKDFTLNKILEGSIDTESEIIIRIMRPSRLDQSICGLIINKSFTIDLKILMKRIKKMG